MKRTLAALLIVTAVFAVSSSTIAQTKDLVQKPQKAVDPVCGLTVDKLPELSYSYKGETYYFCSKGCKTKFDANPGQFVK